MGWRSAELRSPLAQVARHKVLVEGRSQRQVAKELSLTLVLLQVPMAKRSSSKRELIDTGTHQVFAKRGAKGQFKEMDVGRSLTVDRRRAAKATVKSGHGDQGDRPKKK